MNMTSFDPLHPKTGAIIELLADTPSLSTRELLQQLRGKKKMTLSTPNFYKILAKMINCQMLVKTGDIVSINLVWMTHLHRYANLMHEHAAPEDDPFPPLKEGERRTFTAESLDKIDPIWTHLILHLFLQEKDPVISVYESHPWYILGRSDTERRMYESCYTRGKRIQILYGNAHFLDQYGYRLHKTSPCSAFITGTPPFPKEGYNLWLCGNYIMECIFSDLIAQYFASFFQNTKNPADFDLKTFSSIFSIKVPVELHVSRDRKKAETLRKAFKEGCVRKV